MKILVTGAKGQVGSAICRLGAQTSFNIVGLDSRELDVGDEAMVKAVMSQIKPDALVNAAAYTAVDRAEQEREKAFRVNADGPTYLARAAASADIPLLHFSTDYVFDGSKNGAYVETDPVAPMGIYGLSKLAGERAVQATHAQHLVIRTSWVFGFEGHNFPKTMLRLAAERPEIRVVADQWGCPTFADDIARAVFHILGRYQANKSVAWGLYHYAGQPSCSWYGFAGYILNQAYREGLIGSLPLIKGICTAEYPTPAKRPANSKLDCGRFMDTFSGACLSDWGAGVDELIKRIKSTL